MGLNTDWLYWLTITGVCAANIVLVYVAWWALFSDRAKGRRRCPRCWYDLAYSPGATCAECGFTAVKESQLYATRRRYKVALAAIFCSVALSGYVSDRMSQQGWTPHMPTGWLLAMLPMTEDFNGSVGRELVVRATTGELTRRQWIDLLERCVSGDWRASPVSDAWIKKYGWFVSANRQSLRSDPQLEDLLRLIPPQLDVKTLPVWPEGADAVAMVQLRDWWPWGMECRVRATPRVVGENKEGEVRGSSITFYRSAEGRTERSPFPLALPSIGPEANEVTIDFQVDRRRAKAALREGEKLMEWEPVLTHTITLPIRLQKAGEATLQPVDSLELADTLARVFNDSPVRFGSNRSPVRFRMATNSTDNILFDDVALGMSVELLHHDGLARQLNVWWLGGGISGGRRYGYEIAYESPDLAAMTQLDDPKAWTLRVRGQRDLALRVGAGTKFWDGELTIPVQLTRMAGPTPQRAWWTEADVATEE
jgi:hypothetical protein